MAATICLVKLPDSGMTHTHLTGDNEILSYSNNIPQIQLQPCLYEPCTNPYLILYVECE